MQNSIKEGFYNARFNPRALAQLTLTLWGISGSAPVLALDNLWARKLHNQGYIRVCSLRPHGYIVVGLLVYCPIFVLMQDIIV